MISWFQSLLISCLITLSPHLLWADTSELALGLEVETNVSVKQENIHSDYGLLEAKNHTSQLQQSFLFQTGLGLSFTSTIWLNLGFKVQDQLFKPKEQNIQCLDPEREQRLQQGSPLQSTDQCFQLQSPITTYQSLLELAYSYKPYDDLSPFLDLRLGLAYQASTQQTMQLNQSVADGNRETWQKTDLGFPLQLEKHLYLFPKLLLGFEKRVQSRWGLRGAFWAQTSYLVNQPYQGLNLLYGIAVSVIYYQYIRLL